MSKTVNTGWREVTPGRCFECGSEVDWDCDGRGNVMCACQACPECYELSAYNFHASGCPTLLDALHGEDLVTR